MATNITDVYVAMTTNITDVYVAMTTNITDVYVVMTTNITDVYVAKLHVMYYYVGLVPYRPVDVICGKSGVLDYS